MQKNATLTSNQWRLLLVVWFVMQLFFLLATGIITTGESSKYTGIADQLSRGDFNIPGNYWLYIGYIFFLLPLKFMHLSYLWMYAIQVCMAAVSYTCFIKILEQFLSSPLAVIITAVLFCVCPFFQSWNCFIYTDGMFASVLMIAVYYLFKRDSGTSKIMLLACAILLPFFRPVGFLFIPIAIAHLFINKSPGYVRSIIFLGCYLLIPVVFIWYSLTQVEGYFFPQHISEANIICGYPSDLTKYIVHPYREHESVISFLLANTSLTWRLLLYRFYKTFWLTRPFFSNAHNLVLVLNLSVYYALALTGIAALFNRKIFRKTVCLFFGLLVFSLPTIFFCADWDNRLVLPALDFIFLLTGFGVNTLVLFFSRSRIAFS